MRKITRILCLLTAVSLSVGMAGCGDKLKSRIPAFSEIGDGGYIRPYDMFFYYNDGERVFYEDGDAYKKILDSDKEDDEKLLWLQPFVLSGSEFQQYISGGGAYLNYTSGSWKDNNDAIEFTYDEQHIKKTDGTWNVVYADESKNEDNNSRPTKVIVQKLKEADENDTLMGYSAILSDKYSGALVPFIKCGENWERYSSNENKMTCSCLIKDDYILAEQRGLAFEGVTLKSEFTIVYDSMLAEPDKYDESSVEKKIVFKADHTYSLDVGNYAGEWTLYDDHLLILKPLDEKSGAMPIIYYVDLDSEEIYMPLYVKCSGVEKLAK